jgi:hypothetical protein
VSRPPSHGHRLHLRSPNSSQQCCRPPDGLVSIACRQATIKTRRSQSPAQSLQDVTTIGEIEYSRVRHLYLSTCELRCSQGSWGGCSGLCVLPTCHPARPTAKRPCPIPATPLSPRSIGGPRKSRSYAALCGRGRVAGGCFGKLSHTGSATQNELPKLGAVVPAVGFLGNASTGVLRASKVSGNRRPHRPTHPQPRRTARVNECRATVTVCNVEWCRSERMAATSAGTASHIPYNAARYCSAMAEPSTSL